MSYFKKALILLFITSSAISSKAQGNFEKMGRQAFMKSDYRNAVTQLEKAEGGQTSASVQKMLGYSYFQCGDYEQSIASYSKLISLKPADYSAYYYRGKARLNVANAPKESLNQMRESFYTSAIKDFTKAIEISGEEDAQILQNRGIAYKDYAIFKSYKAKKAIDKNACIAIFNNSIADFQKILTMQPLRKDIVGLVDYVKAQITSLK
jgi:Flp pilus assembly protein TadD